MNFNIFVRISLILSILLLTKNSVIFGQTNFHLKGRTNLMFSGKAILFEPSLSSFYSYKLAKDTVDIENGQFEFVGIIDFPQVFYVKLINDKIFASEIFFVDTGFQTLFIDSINDPINFWDFGCRAEMSGSAISYEYENKYYGKFNYIKNETKKVLENIDKADTIMNISLKKRIIKDAKLKISNLKKNRDSIFLSYTTQNPSSKIIPWILSRLIFKYGYNETYITALEIIKGSTSQKMIHGLDSILLIKKALIVGNNFPLLDYINFHENAAKTKELDYTLVDFWFSSCYPCLKQFEALVPVFNKYSAKGLRIVAISIDSKFSIDKYNFLLKRKKYPWEQILDLNGEKTKGLGINKFPTNYLLDKAGKIIAVDISPDDLNIYLLKNQKTNYR